MWPYALLAVAREVQLVNFLVATKTDIGFSINFGPTEDPSLQAEFAQIGFHLLFLILMAQLCPN